MGEQVTEPLNVVEITEKDDPRIVMYTELKDTALSARHGRFIAEGPETIKMLLNSPVGVESLCLKPTIFESLKPFIIACGKQPIVYLMSKNVMAEVVGYTIDRGALACGVIPTHRDCEWLREHLKEKKYWNLLVVDGINDVANMGGMIRTSRGLAMDAVLISQDCCDPWYRRAVRVSMGHVFHLPVVRSQDLAQDLLRMNELDGLVSYAAVIDSDAPTLTSLRSQIADRWGCVLGNEDKGVSVAVRAACQDRVRIEMADGVDSLNVGIAAGILLHGMREAQFAFKRTAEQPSTS